MKVELLYFADCPSYAALLPELRALLASEGNAEEVELRRVETVEDAERERFLGSPTVRVNGTDIEPGAAGREDFGVKCRLYRSDGALVHAPPAEWIRAALRAAA